MVRFYFSLSWLLLCLVVFFGHSVKAQSSGSTSSAVVCVVKDKQGALIVGANITAQQKETNLERSAQTDERGASLLNHLPPGIYSLTVKADGFATVTTKIVLNLGVTALEDFTLPTSTSNETIEVIGSSLLDYSKTENSTNIRSDEIDSLPIQQRTFLNFSFTVPRVVLNRARETTVAPSTSLSINGQSARFNNITIDGLDNNDRGNGAARSTFSQDSVQEFQVISDSYSAEFGRALSGIINIVTKSGTNQLHSSLFGFYRNKGLSSNNAILVSRGNFNQAQFGATLGGAIKKDKAFFFASFEKLREQREVAVNIPDNIVAAFARQGFPIRTGIIPSPVSSSALLARTDLRLSQYDTISARYNTTFLYDGLFDSFGGTSAETNGGIQRLKDYSFAIGNTYINPKINLVNDTRVLYSYRNQKLLPLGDGPRVVLDDPNNSALSYFVGRARLFPQPRREDIFQIINTTSIIKGAHQIKFGIDFNYTKANGFVTFFSGGGASFVELNFSSLAQIPGLPTFSSLQAFDPASRTPEQKTFLTVLSGVLPSMFPGFPKNVPLNDLSLPISFQQGFINGTVIVPLKQASGFFQDDIKLKDNLLLKVGLRYDVNKLGGIIDNNGLISPRLSISYHPLEKLNIRAGYGLFVGSPLFGAAVIAKSMDANKFKLPVFIFPFSILPFSLPNHRFPETPTLPPQVTIVPQLQPTFSYQPDFNNQSAQHITLALDYLINKNTKFSSTYLFIRGLNLFSSRQINPIVNPIPGNPLASNLTGRLNPNIGQVFEFESAYDSYYHALTLSLERQFTRNFVFLAHYTFSKTIDNSEDFTSETRANPLHPELDRSLSVQDVRSRFVFSSILSLDEAKNRWLRHFQISTIININSGRPFNLIAGQDLNMDGETTDRPLGLGRNVGISPGFFNIDARLTRNFLIKEKVRLQVFLEAFNLSNRINIVFDGDEAFPPDAQGNFNLPPKRGGRFILPQDRRNRAASPRQLQVGFRMSF